jgi:hypothetical protein
VKPSRHKPYFAVPSGLKKPDTLIPLLLALVAAVLMAACIHDGHDWGGDFALYIEQSRALLDGSMRELYEVNRFAMDHSKYEVGPYLYPYGFPVLLSPVTGAAGVHFVAMKIWCSLFFIAAIPLLYAISRQYLGVWSSAWVTGLIAMHFGFVQYADHILSDLPFLFFALLALWMMPRVRRVRHHAALGLIFLSAWQVRDAGIVLLPAFAAFQWTGFRAKRHDSGPLLKSLIAYGVFAAGYFFIRTVLPDGGENHLRKIGDRLSWEVIATNLGDYAGLLSEYFCLPLWMLSAIGALVLTGMIQGVRRYPHLIVFLAGSVVIVLIWPHFQGMRFVFPILPVLLICTVTGAEAILRKTGGARGAAVLAGLLALWTISHSVADVSRYAGRDTNYVWTPEMREWYDYLRLHVAQDEIVAFEKPRVLRLFSGVNAIFSDPGHFTGSVADYLLVHEYYLPQGTGTFRVVRASGPYYLLRRGD